MNRVAIENEMMTRRTTQAVVILRHQVVQQGQHSFSMQPAWDKAFQVVCGVKLFAKGTTVRKKFALHPILKSRRRGHVDLFRASLIPFYF